VAKKLVTLEDVKQSVIADLEKILVKVKKSKGINAILEFDCIFSRKSFALLDRCEAQENEND